MSFAASVTCKVVIVTFGSINEVFEVNNIKPPVVIPLGLMVVSVPICVVAGKNPSPMFVSIKSSNELFVPMNLIVYQFCNVLDFAFTFPFQYNLNGAELFAVVVCEIPVL